MKTYTGDEKFILNGKELPIGILEFWQWAYSDIESNMAKGVLAEYIVKAAIAYNGPDTNGDSRYWRPYDLIGPGGLRLEVKSSAYLQMRDQTQTGLAKISFGIAPTKFYNEATDFSKEYARHSDVYVFCVWTSKDKSQSILDMDTWEFYPVATKVFDENYHNQKTLSFGELKRLCPEPVKFNELRHAIMIEYANRGPFTSEF